jgi:hypothetical protein
MHQHVCQTVSKRPFHQQEKHVQQGQLVRCSWMYFHGLIFWAHGQTQSRNWQRKNATQPQMLSCVTCGILGPAVWCAGTTGLRQLLL